MGNSGSPEKRPSSELDGADPLKQNLSPRKSKEIDRNIAVVTPINIKDTTLAEEKKIVKISIIGSVSVGKKTLFCQYLFVSNINNYNVDLSAPRIERRFRNLFKRLN